MKIRWQRMPSYWYCDTKVRGTRSFWPEWLSNLWQWVNNAEAYNPDKPRLP